MGTETRTWAQVVYLGGHARKQERETGMSELGKQGISIKGGLIELVTIVSD